MTGPAWNSPVPGSRAAPSECGPAARRSLLEIVVPSKSKVPTAVDRLPPGKEVQHSTGVGGWVIPAGQFDPVQLNPLPAYKSDSTRAAEAYLAGALFNRLGFHYLQTCFLTSPEQESQSRCIGEELGRRVRGMSAPSDRECRAQIMSRYLTGLLPPQRGAIVAEVRDDCVQYCEYTDQPLTAGLIAHRRQKRMTAPRHLLTGLREQALGAASSDPLLAGAFALGELIDQGLVDDTVALFLDDRSPDTSGWRSDVVNPPPDLSPAADDDARTNRRWGVNDLILTTRCCGPCDTPLKLSWWDDVNRRWNELGLRRSLPQPPVGTPTEWSKSERETLVNTLARRAYSALLDPAVLPTVSFEDRLRLNDEGRKEFWYEEECYIIDNPRAFNFFRALVELKGKILTASARIKLLGKGATKFDRKAMEKYIPEPLFQLIEEYRGFPGGHSLNLGRTGRPGPIPAADARPCGSL